MVLAELGGKLRESLRKFQYSSSQDTAQLNTLLSEIARALIESDVNVKLVMSMRENVKQKVSAALQEDKANANVNVAKLVQNTVMDELTSLMTPAKRKAYAMTRGKPNVVLFVGLYSYDIYDRMGGMVPLAHDHMGGAHDEQIWGGISSGSIESAAATNALPVEVTAM